MWLRVRCFRMIHFVDHCDDLFLRNGHLVGGVQRNRYRIRYLHRVDMLTLLGYVHIYNMVYIIRNLLVTRCGRIIWRDSIGHVRCFALIVSVRMRVALLGGAVRCKRLCVEMR